MMNYIIEYNNQIRDSTIVAPDKIKVTYQYLADKITGKIQDGYTYDNDRALRAINFMQTFCHLSKGKTGGKTIKLVLAQKALVSAIFGFVDAEGYRQYKEVVYLVGRKNGKSALASCIALYMLIADGESTPEIYSCATKRDQAKIIWEETARMIKKSPAIRKYCKLRVGDIYCTINDGSFKPLASDSNSLDGLNVSCALLDELHAWKDSNMYDVIVDGCTARQQPLILITSTAGTVRQGIYDLKYQQASDIINSYRDGKCIDDTFLPIIYELDNKEEWHDSKKWVKANPLLGISKDIKQLADKVRRAEHGHKDVTDVLTKDFNLPQTGSSAYLTWEEIKNPATFDLSHLDIRYGIGAFDLSRTTDMTAAIVIFKQRNDPTIYAKGMVWLPSEQLEKRIKEDKIPYQKWIERGLMRVCDGHTINYKDILHWFIEIQERDNIYFYKIGYDNYGAIYLTQDMEAQFGKKTLEEVRQGAKTLSIPLQNLKAALAAKQINYNNNPVMAYCLAQLQVKQDINGNLQPDKNRAKRAGRDDLAMALLDAYTVYQRYLEDYENIC